MAKKPTDQVHAVARIKQKISPSTPCVNADAEGYCTGPCEGSICFKCADYQPRQADCTAAAPALPLEHPPAGTPAEAVKFDLGMAKRHGALTLAYLARAGWRLACEKEGQNYGAWTAWCNDNLGFSKDTADRYISFYHATVGAHLRAQGAAHRLVDNLTDAMIEEACAGLESKTATGAMIELGIVKRPANWGGARENAGRKSKDDADAEAAELDEIANNPALLYAAAKGPLDELWKLHRERNLFARLGDDELTEVVGVLQPLYKYAAGILKGRAEARMGRSR